jgi:esterase/lipase superfamily enzyme
MVSDDIRAAIWNDLTQLLGREFPGISIGPEDNIRKKFRFSESSWMAFGAAINNLPNVKMLNLQVTPQVMERISSLHEIADALFSSAPAAEPRKASPPTRRGRKNVTTWEEADRYEVTPGATGAAISESRVNDTYRVWYGTNRKPVDSRDINKGYSAERDSDVHVGACQVFIPESHQMGSLGSSLAKRMWTGVDDRLKLVDINESPQDKFWEEIASHVKSFALNERDGVVFIHGYNVSFENAALRAAQIGHDLSIKSAMAFFSWPSQGTLGGYNVDEATIEASEPFIAKFLVDFAEQSGASKIHIIAHSMGNRGVLRAVNAMLVWAQKRTSVPFDQIILAAADVDAGTFKNLYSAYARVARRTTLYVSSRDRAVEASQWLHDFPRAGLLPPLMVVNGIDTINVTNADMTMLGHGYVAETKDVLQDMFYVMQGFPTEQRFNLKAGKTESGEKYWLIGK